MSLTPTFGSCVQPRPVSRLGRPRRPGQLWVRVGRDVSEWVGLVLRRPVGSRVRSRANPQDRRGWAKPFKFVDALVFVSSLGSYGRQFSEGSSVHPCGVDVSALHSCRRTGGTGTHRDGIPRPRTPTGRAYSRRRPRRGWTVWGFTLDLRPVRTSVRREGVVVSDRLEAPPEEEGDPG